MESAFLTFILLSSLAVYSFHADVTDWDDVVVAREGSQTTLICTDPTVRGDVTINWKTKLPGAKEWRLVLVASKRETFSGGASKPSMELTDPNFLDTGVFSLSFLPKMEDGGLYSCMIKEQERNLKERIILLAILKVIIVPAVPISRGSTLRLIARVKPDIGITKIIWVAPGNVSLKSEKKINTGTVAKLPQVQTSDSGAYVCVVLPSGNSNNTLFAFNVDVIVDADNVASFTNTTHGPLISTATLAKTSFTLTCPVVQGDYVLLYRKSPDSKKQKLVYKYDRWRVDLSTKPSKTLQLAGSPYNAEAGSFSFLLTPGWKDGGLYSCDVFLNDNIFSKRTKLSVLEVKTSLSSSKLELVCYYSERSQVQSVGWKHQDKSRQLRMSTGAIGSIIVTLPLPITPDTAGNYTCTLQLKNGQTVWAMHAVTLPHEGVTKTETTPSPLPSLSALLLLVPLVAAAVGVLLWRQKHISDRGIEQSLSAHSGETENIYEHPEDIRQAPPEGSVYMDLKARGEDDVYMELEQSEQCQS